MAILREDLLVGSTVVLTGDRGTLREPLAGLGATVLESPGAAGDAADAMVHDAGGAFAGGGSDALLGSLEQTWIAVAEVANAALITSGRGGKVVLIAPRADAGALAAAARAALQNLARTLSVEWARYGITVTAILPAPAAREEDIALFTAYLLSRAGDYFSGCGFELAGRQR
jgi:NAD(P)-dependent dehydrogenase (short-subunit alcohol dehydrogenase family)